MLGAAVEHCCGLFHDTRRAAISKLSCSENSGASARNIEVYQREGMFSAVRVNTACGQNTDMKVREEDTDYGKQGPRQADRHSHLPYGRKRQNIIPVPLPDIGPWDDNQYQLLTSVASCHAAATMR